MIIEEYIEAISRRYSLGNSTEHTFRGDLQGLLESILSDVNVTNEPKRQACGAPDFILSRRGIDIGYIEAKDIGDQDLDGKKSNKEQFERYKSSLQNLIFTNYLDFHFYRNGECITKLSLGSVENGAIRLKAENVGYFKDLILDFCSYPGQSIKSSQKLARLMAGKARLLADIIYKSLTHDDENNHDSTLRSQFKAFEQILIHDIKTKEFADIYAQTITYGMFAARLNDPTLDTFSRQEAAELIPKSNPFLRKLFGYIAGPDIDDRIKWVVDNLADVFRASNVEEILSNFGKGTKTEDPIIHFYETFLSEYDPKLRKSRGVWYTPQPVVDFIVRAVDDILKTEFDLPQGLADTSKTIIKSNTQTPDKRSATGYKQVEKEVHKVQIIDPATGTGTFLAEVVKHIHKKFEGQQGVWSNYVETHLLPRLNGFELLMASYAMAHLKLDILLTETGYKPTSNQRFKVYLTNSLEEHHQDTGTLFANWLSEEANEANHIKRDTPVMCVIGNPPYSGISSNNGEWISNLIEDYKYVDGVHFNERKHWLNDDYVKFLRYGQHLIEKNGSGVLAFINPHGFLDNPTFRGMRWHLLKTYDKIYIHDLHGNSKKKETAPDGSADVNVFDIQQGVSINIFVKTGKKKANELGEVFHFDKFGTRNDKYDFLSKNSISSLQFEKPAFQKPFYFFKPFNYRALENYQRAIKITDLFESNSVGCVSANDTLNISYSKNEQKQKINDIIELEESTWRNEYNRPKDAQSWKYRWARQDAIDNISKNLSSICYRPFDIRYTLYTGKSGGLYARPVNQVMHHFIENDNIGLVVGRQGHVVGNMQWNLIYTTKSITDFNLFYRGGGMLFPLYKYPQADGQLKIGQSQERVPNIDMENATKFASHLGLTFTNEKETTENTFAPIDILNYIYSVLHSPTYRGKYKEFLKTDFPRIPFPKDQNTFWQLVKLGREIRKIHLLESPTVEQYITQYPMDGDNVVGKPKYKDGKVYINDVQFFESVPQVAWEFYIGGYQPAQKWLKDRKGRALDYKDIMHYQKIIVALSETDRIMKEIDGVTEF